MKIDNCVNCTRWFKFCTRWSNFVRVHFQLELQVYTLVPQLGRGLIRSRGWDLYACVHISLHLSRTYGTPCRKCHTTGSAAPPYPCTHHSASDGYQHGSDSNEHGSDRHRSGSGRQPLCRNKTVSLSGHDAVLDGAMEGSLLRPVAQSGKGAHTLGRVNEGGNSTPAPRLSVERACTRHSTHTHTKSGKMRSRPHTRTQGARDSCTCGTSSTHRRT